MPASTVELNPSDRFRKLLRDPVLLISLIILWSLLSLFILVPLIWLFMRTFEEGGRVKSAGALFDVIGLPQQAALLGPVFVKRQDDFLKSHGSTPLTMILSSVEGSYLHTRHLSEAVHV